MATLLKMVNGCSGMKMESLKEEVHFENGKREGLTVYFSMTGNETAKIIYKDDLLER